MWEYEYNSVRFSILVFGFSRILSSNSSYEFLEDIIIPQWLAWRGAPYILNMASRNTVLLQISSNGTIQNRSWSEAESCIYKPWIRYFLRHDSVLIDSSLCHFFFLIELLSKPNLLKCNNCSNGVYIIWTSPAWKMKMWTNMEFAQW